MRLIFILIFFLLMNCITEQSYYFKQVNRYSINGNSKEIKFCKDKPFDNYFNAIEYSLAQKENIKISDLKWRKWVENDNYCLIAKNQGNQID